MGEFERRIILMIGKGKYDSKRVKYLGKVADMVDEARKEFPELNMPADHEVYPDEALDVYFAFHNNVKRWFKKWLGAAK